MTYMYVVKKPKLREGKQFFIVTGNQRLQIYLSYPLTGSLYAILILHKKNQDCFHF